MKKRIISIPIIKYGLILIAVFFVTMIITMLINNAVKNKNASLTNKDSLSKKDVNEINISSQVLVSDEEEQKELEENAEQIESDEDKPAHVESSSPYYVRINTAANCVTIYARGEDGEYSNPVKAMVCSTGSYTPPCGKYPKNLYKLPGSRWEWGALQQDVYGHYVTKIVGNILFHSVPYTENYNSGSLEWWEYDKLGTSASAGCIRLQIKDAQWVYNNLPGGTYIEFYQSSNPGPLGKPSAPKISGNEACRNWDPTDGNVDNPWNNGGGNKQEQPQVIPEPKPDQKNNNKINPNTQTNTSSESNKDNNQGEGESSNKIENIINTNTNIENQTSSIPDSDTNSVPIENTNLNENINNNSNSENYSNITAGNEI